MQFLHCVILLGAGILLHFCSFSASDKQIGTTGEYATGTENTMQPSMTPLPPINEIRQGNYNYPPFTPGYRPYPKCPLCDSSVYPYCGEKLLHDACCCTDPRDPDLPYQCRLADCRFLHANSCREHRLIANCCCSDDYRALLNDLVKSP